MMGGMMMQPNLTNADQTAICARLQSANADLAERYPGDPTGRQPVHTVYGGAHLFRHDVASRLGKRALSLVDVYAPDTDALARAVGLTADGQVNGEVYRRMRRKLEKEPVEDYRIDFEDGYGSRPDQEEDQCAAAAATEVAVGLEQASLPPFIGIRIKPFSGELAGRALRTMDIFLTTLLERSGGSLPAGFIVTIPKVMIPEHVSAAADALDRLDPEGRVRMEIMVETPQSIIDHEGRSPLPSMVAAARGRCAAAHFGVYDYTASMNITAHYQQMSHPVCDFARQAMQVALAGTGIMLSDGATNIMPTPPHDSAETAEQEAENRRAVHDAWRLHYDDVQRSLIRGYYQGWDLNPGQLPTRYAAVFAFFLESLASAQARLGHFVQQAAKATLMGGVFDDAATGQGLLNFFLRGLNCGAITEQEAKGTGLTVEEIQQRSFARILKGRASAR